MLALSLGVAWLLLAPLCLWLLVKGSNRERVAAIMSLVLLEGGTIVMDGSLHRATPVHSAVAHDVSPAPTATCDERAPALRSAAVAEDLVLTWAASRRECGTAEVTVRAKGRRLLVWVHAGAGDRRAGHDDGVAVPVRVEGGTAAVTVPLPAKPSTRKSRYILVDGRSGHRIPAPVPGDHALR